MKKIHIILFVSLFANFTLESQAQVAISLNPSAAKYTISKHIYGHFAEHLGRSIYDGFYVGENNTQIPNKAGVRTDVVEALKKLKIPNLRWPGGCFADTYHWKDGIGDKAKRPTIVNMWWGGVTENNSFGTHDFLNMCELLNTEPYLAGNMATGSVQELADWVQYVNYPGESPMSNLRRENGRDKPWKVKYWGVGNEAWGCGGNMTPDYYANEFRKYATFLSSWTNDNGIFRVASGANSADYNWTEVIMKNVPKTLIEGMALHHYSVIDWNKKGSATAFDEQAYFTTMQRALQMEELVSKHSAIMDKYDAEKKVALIVDEWGGWYEVEKGTNPGFLYQQNTIRDAMIAGVTLNIFNNHADRVRMANLAQAINVLQSVILTKGNKMLLTPTYHVMEMYNVHQDATLIPLEIKNIDYSMGKEMLPTISASASKAKDGKVHISLVNIDAKNAREITLDLKDLKAKVVSGRILTSAKIQDYNSFERPDAIKPAEFKNTSMKQGKLTVKLPPVSVVVLELI